jgi:hypothetical protein
MFLNTITNTASAVNKVLPNETRMRIARHTAVLPEPVPKEKDACPANIHAEVSKRLSMNREGAFFDHSIILIISILLNSKSNPCLCMQAISPGETQPLSTGSSTKS